MTALALFAYPIVPHVRRHGPLGYDAVETFKQWLRDEFAFRCVYCLERECWYPDRSASFSGDHIIPRSLAPLLVRAYSNLVYSCTRCNSFRQDEPLLDPTATALGDHLQMAEDGMLLGKTVQGQKLIVLLRLNRSPALQVRRKYLGIRRLRQQYPDDPIIAAVFLDAFGWPDDMPDLRRSLPPGGNAMPGSEDQCHFARRERGELPAVY